MSSGGTARSTPNSEAGLSAGGAEPCSKDSSTWVPKAPERRRRRRRSFVTYKCNRSSRVQQKPQQRAKTPKTRALGVTGSTRAIHQSQAEPAEPGRPEVWPAHQQRVLKAHASVTTRHAQERRAGSKWSFSVQPRLGIRHPQFQLRVWNLDGKFGTILDQISDPPPPSKSGGFAPLHSQEHQG